MMHNLVTVSLAYFSFIQGVTTTTPCVDDVLLH